MFTPWNEIRPKKCPSPGIPVVQLWQNPCNQSYPIPLGPALWNEVFSIELLSLGILATRSEQNLYRPSDPIPPGFTPWNQNSYLKHPELFLRLFNVQ